MCDHGTCITVSFDKHLIGLNREENALFSSEFIMTKENNDPRRNSIKVTVSPCKLDGLVSFHLYLKFMYVRSTLFYFIELLVQLLQFLVVLCVLACSKGSWTIARVFGVASKERTKDAIFERGVEEKK